MPFARNIVFLVSVLMIFRAHSAIGGINQYEPELSRVEQLKTFQPDSAFQLVRSAYSRTQKDGDEALKARYALELGEILYYLGDYENSNQYLLEAAEYFEINDDKRKLAEVCTWQGIVTQYAKQLPMALGFYQKAFDLYKSLNDSLKIGELYGWIGHYYEKNAQPDTALAFQYKARDILIRQKNSESSLAQIYDNIGSLYEDRGIYDSAHFYFFSSYVINRSFHEINGQIVNLNNIGDVFRKKGQTSMALTYTDSALMLAENYNIDYQRRSAHRDLSKIYFLIKDYENAYQHLEQSYEIYTEILNEENSKRITLLQTMYESEKQENRIRLLEKEKRINQILRFGMITAFLILLSVAVIVIRNQIVKVKQGKKIIEQNTLIYDKEKELGKLELKNALLKEEKLKTEINNRKILEHELQQNLELKSQLITSQTLQIIRKNNFLENLKKELQQIKKGDKPERSERINSLMRSINHDISSDENWNDFNTIFSQVHKDFFSDLRRSFPDISPAELRLCSLLKLNLSSQEIATILGISTDSLRIARYRLRKKLDLDKNDNLVGFLINI
jgi:tetratricopeptide (TPR) repeat protein